MDWNRKEDDRQAPTHIVEMLVALAFLADCACSRSYLLRRLILLILTPAEAYARNFVIAEARAAGFAIDALPVPVHSGDSVADAMRLAACFRALAMVLQQLPIQTAHIAGWWTSHHTPLRYLARILLHMLSGPAVAVPQPFDTS